MEAKSAKMLDIFDFQATGETESEKLFALVDLFDFRATTEAYYQARLSDFASSNMFVSK